jgi:hypothetical protein
MNPTQFNARLWRAAAWATFALVAVVVAGRMDADTATRSVDAERENRAAGMEMMEAAR